MRRIAILVFGLALAGLLASPGSRAQKAAAAPGPEQTAPSLEEIRALADRAIAGQHKDDDAIECYERIEHHVVRSGANDRPSEDRTYRVVPTGTGTLKLIIRDGGKVVPAEEYLRQLEIWEQILDRAQHPDDPRMKADLERYRKHQKDRAEFVDAARQAYHATWLGREIWNGRVFAKLQLEPRTDYHPTSRLGDILLHARAMIWIDEGSGQLARGDAEIIRDISFGGGILGKVYRGGRFQLEQAEISPGVWLPTRLQYDFMGRKFLFGFEVHEYTEISHYRRLGSPSEALAIVRREIQNKEPLPGDP